MKKFAAALAVTMLATAAPAWAQDAHKMPTPQKEHGWLKRLAGEWSSDVSAAMEPGKPPVKAKGTESARLVGDFWFVAEGRGEMMGQPMTSYFTLGYDAQKKKYVGTWVCSGCDHLWTYEGVVDSTGKVLTLETDGPDPMRPGKTAKFREVLEVKSDDHKVFTSYAQAEDGKWVPFVTVDYHRKK